MKQEIKSLIDAKNQWEKDIKMYKEFLKGEAQTIEGRYGAQEYISMAENRLIDINQKLKEIKHNSEKYFQEG
tara:strand:+ start:1164 stop:1379 length:216 start_codon:yes stop_codon:yes gene_type:complete